MFITKIENKLKLHNNFFSKALLKIGHYIKAVVKLIVKKDYRANVYMKTIHRSRTQQTTQYTSMNRYPNEFLTAKTYFDNIGKKDIKILSYGCCTGEEVVTLRYYFPEATIVGAEINKNSLKICKERGLDSNIHFIKSKPALIKKYGPFDMVLAMAVLERTPHYVKDKGITDLSGIYPYEKYEKQIYELDSYLKDGGLFLSSYSHYYVLDTPIGNNYKVYGNSGFIGQTFDTNSRLKTSGKLVNDVFVKNVVK